MGPMNNQIHGPHLHFCTQFMGCGDADGFYTFHANVTAKLHR
jgi:hypothetical protein